MPCQRVLQTWGEVVEAAAEAERRGLPPATDFRKHWDNLLALDTIMHTEGPVADLGCRSGILLTWLHHVGRRKLHGCDVRRPWPPAKIALQHGQFGTARTASAMYRANRRNMRRSRAESTGFPSDTFAAVTSMSVVEHYVDTPAFFAEAYRLLKPGGRLFLSTDYWPTGGETPDGVVFSTEDVGRMVREAASAGFDTQHTLDLTAPEEPVIETYTFLVLGFEKRPGA